MNYHHESGDAALANGFRARAEVNDGGDDDDDDDRNRVRHIVDEMNLEDVPAAYVVATVWLECVFSSVVMD